MQLAHLKWRKCVNDTKIRTQIDTSRALQERDLLLQLSENRSAQRGEWRKAVIEDELTKPLEVGAPLAALGSALRTRLEEESAGGRGGRGRTRG
jgi:hypothetical protein